MFPISNHADTQIGKLAAGNTSEFAQSLVRQYNQRGKLSDKQWHWVNKLVAELDRPAAPAAPTTDLSGVITLLQDAKQHLKFPAIRLTASDGTPVVLKVAGDRAKEPGTVNATDGGSYPDNRWFGRIALDGAFKPGRDCTTDVIDVLVRLGCDPATVAAEHGKLTGSCSFCRQPLSDERSTEVGYGPVCAKHFGLPWGGNAKAA